MKSPLNAPAPLASFNAFLYSSIGEDNNGMPLTVLSALARQDLDPWEVSARLSDLPAGTAVDKLAAMIASIPSGSSVIGDPTAIAGPLIALLPPHAPVMRAPPTRRPADAVHGSAAVKTSSAPAKLLFIAMYLAMMVFGQWLAARVSAPVAEAHPQVAQAAAKVDESH
jgi:hypothetical protein